jgi:hypothetical protein
MSPIYSYLCPYGHRHETLRKYEHRFDADPCPKCGAPTDYVISAPHVEPDGVHSYCPNLGSADNYERKAELHRVQQEERAERRETKGWRPKT